VRPQELAALLREPMAWMEGDGPCGGLVISTRVRFARNLAGRRFPSVAGEQERRDVEAMLFDAARDVLPGARTVSLGEVSERARAILVEKFLISPQLAAGASGALVLFDGDASGMVNEEDHLRLQCILPGLDLQGAFARAEALDDALESRLDFAFSERWGYLTSCPSNAGTGMRASVMLHLPALAVSGALPRVFEGLAGLGVTARGIYGEGTDAAGAVFQISNQATLGAAERELLAKVEGVARSLIEREGAAREDLLQTARDAVVDRIWRAFGTLKTARAMGYGEAAELLSLVRWGSHERILPEIARSTLNALLYRIGPAALGGVANEGSSSAASTGGNASANRLRATLLREAFSAYPC